MKPTFQKGDVCSFNDEWPEIILGPATKYMIPAEDFIMKW